MSDEANSNIIIVASGKVGVGKTWFAVHLAQSLVSRNKRVLLFDADFKLANLSEQIGLKNEKSLADVIDGHEKLAQIITPYVPETVMDFPSMDVIANVPQQGDVSSAKLILLRQSLMQLSTNYDYVVVDLGTGIDQNVQDLSELGQKCIIVVTEDSVSLTEAYAYIKIMTQQHPTLGVQVVVNMVGDEHKGQRVYDKLARVCQEYLNRKPTLLGFVHDDPRVNTMIHAQTPFWTRYPSAQPTKDIEKISQRVVDWA